MKKNAEEMRPEYDFSKAKRIVPPYDQRPSSHEPRVTVHRADGTSETRSINAEASIAIYLEPDLAAAFPSQESVNTALRQFLEISRILNLTPTKKRAKRAA